MIALGSRGEARGRGSQGEARTGKPGGSQGKPGEARGEARGQPDLRNLFFLDASSFRDYTIRKKRLRRSGKGVGKRGQPELGDLFWGKKEKGVILNLVIFASAKSSCTAFQEHYAVAVVLHVADVFAKR
jgi:hypothetical protein